MTALAKPTTQAVSQFSDVALNVALTGDTSRLNTPEKLQLVRFVCEQTGINPALQPFAFISFQGKEQLYAKKSAADQLRFIHNVQVEILSKTLEEGLYIVEAKATLPNGRSEIDVGAVNIEGLKGDARANAIMKAVTKAKRRVTLAICGLGLIDESEVETIPNAIVRPAPQPQAVTQPKLSEVQDIAPETWQSIVAELKRLDLNRAAFDRRIKEKYGQHIRIPEDLTEAQGQEILASLRSRETPKKEQPSQPAESVPVDEGMPEQTIPTGPLVRDLPEAERDRLEALTIARTNAKGVSWYEVTRIASATAGVDLEGMEPSELTKETLTKILDWLQGQTKIGLQRMLLEQNKQPA